MINGASTQITYIIPMEVGISKESFSPFCGFSQEFIDKSYFLSIIACLPQDVSELYSPSYINIAYRKEVGDYKILLLNANAISQLPHQALTPFVCIFSSKSTHVQCKKIIAHLSIKPIHVSEVDEGEVISPHELTRNRMRKEFSSISKKYASYLEEKDKIALKKIISGKPKAYRPSKFKLKHRAHNITRPSECALISQKYRFRKSLHLSRGGNNSYVDGIVDASNELRRIRKQIPLMYIGIKNDFILGLPSFYAYLYKDNSFKRSLRDFGGDLTKNFFEKYVLRYRGYVPTAFKPEIMIEGAESNRTQAVVYIRQKELFAFTNLMSILASEDFVPFIRLPNDLNLLHGMLKNIESLVKGVAKQKNHKLNREFSKLSDFMVNAIPLKISELICRSGEKGVVVSDYPIEWMCLDNDVPLLFTHELCRIGSTPGNVLSEIVCNVERVNFRLSSLRKILVIRSFKKDDPIRNDLETAVKEFSKNFINGTEVVFVDVNSEVELHNALNGYKPFMTVFDCHGNHGGPMQHAWLNIGDDNVNVWKLRNKCYVPVIAMLSACSTHPVAGSHASVANGLLASGVAGVIATSVPIPSSEAAIFVARLIYRIDTFLPLQLEALSRKVCWREFITKMLRMSYVTDILRAYQYAKPQWICEERFTSIHERMNMEINLGNVRWHYVLFDCIASSSNHSVDEVKDFYVKNARFKQSAFYVQIGRTDKVFIVNDNAA